jgi:hypothetical protein
VPVLLAPPPCANADALTNSANTMSSALMLGSFMSSSFTTRDHRHRAVNDGDAQAARRQGITATCTRMQSRSQSGGSATQLPVAETP